MRVADRCHALTGLACFPPWTVNCGLVVGGEATLVVDTSMTRESARTVLGYARAVAPANRLVVFNTERHLDHLGGNALFAEEGAELLGHAGIVRTQEELDGFIEELQSTIGEEPRRRAGEMAIAFEGTTVVNPSVAVEGGAAIDLGGGVRAEVIATPGHTATNLSILVPGARALFSGDCVVARYLPNDGEADVTAWLRSLELLAGLDLAVLVPGHGPVLYGEEIGREISRIAGLLAARP